MMSPKCVDRRADSAQFARRSDACRDQLSLRDLGGASSLLAADQTALDHLALIIMEGLEAELPMFTAQVVKLWREDLDWQRSLTAGTLRATSQRTSRRSLLKWLAEAGSRPAW